MMTKPPSDDASGWGTDHAFSWRELSVIVALWVALLLAIVVWQ